MDGCAGGLVLEGNRLVDQRNVLELPGDAGLAGSRTDVLPDLHDHRIVRWIRKYVPSAPSGSTEMKSKATDVRTSLVTSAW